MEKLNSAYFEEIFAILEQEFPLTEYREKNEQRKLLDLDCYHLYGSLNEHGELTVFAAFWEFEDFHFLEHYAVKKAYQGKGYGKAFLKEYLEANPKPLILEVEIPTDSISKRRISFYEGLGLHFHDFLYFQQPLREAHQPTQMHIMATAALSEPMFLPYKKRIYKEIYNRAL